MENTHSCQLDIGYLDETFERFEDRLVDLQNRKLTFKIIKALGPAGGWPLVEIYGTEQAIIDYIKSYDVEYDNNLEQDKNYYQIQALTEQNN